MYDAWVSDLRSCFPPISVVFSTNFIAITTEESIITFVSLLKTSIVLEKKKSMLLPLFTFQL